MPNVLNAVLTQAQTDTGPREDPYPVYPDQEGEWDRPINPYAPG